MVTNGRLNRILKKSKPYFGVIILQFGYAGLAIIAKSALNGGMSHYTFAVYRNATAAVFFAPFALFFERCVIVDRPVIDQNLYYVGMKYTTATFTTALSNVLPAITFLLAWIFRLEKVNVKKLRSQAKILGTAVTVGGAMVMTLVKGPIIGLPWTQDEAHHHHHHPQSSSVVNAHHQQQSSIKGAALIIAGCFCWACFYTLQAITLKSYSAGLSLTCLICGVGALQGTILTLVAERGNSAAWAIHWDAKLLAYTYSGIVCSGIAYYISGAIMKEKGPVFVTAFNPLSMVIVAIMGSFILAEQLDFGRVLGACVIVIGLYLVIWGKDKDGKDKSSNHQTAQDDQELSVMGSTSHQEQESATPGDVVPRTRSRRKFCRREEFRPKPVEAVGKFGITRVDHLEMDASPL